MFRESGHPEPSDWAERETALGECRHYCNGDDILNGHASDVCDFTCHPGLALDPEKAERFEAKLRELEAG